MPRCVSAMRRGWPAALDRLAHHQHRLSRAATTQWSTSTRVSDHRSRRRAGRSRHEVAARALTGSRRASAFFVAASCKLIEAGGEAGYSAVDDELYAEKLMVPNGRSEPLPRFHLAPPVASTRACTRTFRANICAISGSFAPGAPRSRHGGGAHAPPPTAEISESTRSIFLGPAVKTLNLAALGRRRLLP